MIDEKTASEISTWAKCILDEINNISDMREINQLLAELEPYPNYIITITEVQ